MLLLGTSVEAQTLSNVHCFGIGLFNEPHEIEKRVRRSLNLELESGEESTVAAITGRNESLYENETTTPVSRRSDKLCKHLKSIHVLFNVVF